VALLPAKASDATPAKFWRVPVFFVTDRNLEPVTPKSPDTNFGPHRKYIGECKHDPFMGSAYCVIPNYECKPLTQALIDLGWTAADAKDKDGNFKATILPGDSFDNIQKDFYEQVHQKALLTADKNIFVFAHGYKNSFKSGMHTAAKLAYYAERPLIYYSWPSVCAFRSYDSDENNVEWSQEHFNDVVTQLDQLCTDDRSLKVRLMAHSMGTRLTIRACPFLREKSWLAEATLICPDIDAGLVKHYARRYLSANGTTTIRVYMSQRDKALAISQILHGGYTRFGECADSIASLGLKALGAEAAKTQATTPEDEAKFAAVLEKTKKRMQTIDFTDIDLGMVGHSVPAKLICSMSFTNEPCEGLKFENEESGERSKLSQRLSKMTKLFERDEMPIKGTCLRVVKVAESDKKQIAKAPETVSP
jgi:pimeloyl-ACP methyl ester carboxylesterase